MRLTILALVVLLAALRPAWGQLSYDERRTYYRIEGTTVKELSSAMLASGPGGYAAAVASSVNWRYDCDCRASSCRTKSVRVDLDVMFLLPHWTPPVGTSARVRASWDRVHKALKLHERGHRNIWVEAGNKIVETLRLAGPEPSCRRLKSAANRAARAVYEEGKRRNARYDRDTKHGITQGTVFR